ncbi:MAG: GspE/PulE family protein [Deltaproteobacteria bacterium]|nr:GspE/PulE family protein [Deltaproteobacteria bacterium]
MRVIGDVALSAEIFCTTANLASALDSLVIPVTVPHSEAPADVLEPAAIAWLQSRVPSKPDRASLFAAIPDRIYAMGNGGPSSGGEIAPVTQPPSSLPAQQKIVAKLLSENLATPLQIRGWISASRGGAFLWTVIGRHWNAAREEEKLHRLRIILSEHTTDTGIPIINVAEVLTDGMPADMGDIFSNFPKAKALELGVLPYMRSGSILYVVVSSPEDLELLGKIRFATGYTIQAVFAFEHEIKVGIERVYGQDGATKPAAPVPIENIGTAPVRAAGADTSQQITEQSPFVLQLVKNILDEAYRRGTSDIHIAPQKGRLSVRIRRDGLLEPLYLADYEARLLPYAQGVVRKLATDAHMETDKIHLVPQGGVFQWTVGDETMDVRAEVRPTIYGPAISMRLLRSQKIFDLDGLGMDGVQLGMLRAFASQPNGLVLVTGPTGSGKTSLLASLITELARPDIHILTAEHPVEYRLPGGVEQMQIERGLTYEKALHSFLRSDPNIIMLGEIRNPETAQIAVEAADTGHLVFSTLHTNDALSTVQRLVKMGVPGHMLADVLRGIVAQRLVRRLCTEPHCRQKISDPSTVADLLGMTRESLARAEIFSSGKCRQCKNTGYNGRIGIYEVVPPTNEVLAYVFSGAEDIKLRDDAERSLTEAGVVLLRESARRLVMKGITSPQEFERIMGRQWRAS